MNPPPAPAKPAPLRLSVFAAGGLLMLATLAVYANSLGRPFVFDDIPSIVDNPTIRQLRTALTPPGASGQTVSGRPLLNLSFALNYSVGGPSVGSYHALNVAIHLLAGLTLFGILRRTLVLRRLTRPLGDVGRGHRTPPKIGTAAYGDAALQSHATFLAFASALLWIVHPLQTESVTYVVQRAESLMGLFYLLTLYGFIRGEASEKPGRWYAFSVASCLLGMATKEVMVSAPLMVLCYDRTLVAGTFRAAWRQRRRLYLGLAATWLLLGWLVLGTANRGGTAGFGVGVGWWQYVATQFQALAHYLWLAVWPHPLILDYGVGWVKAIPEVVPYALVAAVVVAGTAVAWWRRPALGFLGLWFLAILAPTSLVPGTRQTIAEHRMYLALVPVIVLAVLGAHAWLGRRFPLVLLATALALGWTTVQRNQDYQSELTIWRDIAAKRPQNAWAICNYGAALFRQRQPAAALVQCETALRLQPGLAEAYYNAANALTDLGRIPEAIGHFKAALELQPGYAEAHNNLGNALFQSGRISDAIAQFEAALRIEPGSAKAHYNLGIIRVQFGRMHEAIAEYEAALRSDPDYADAHSNLGNVLFQLGRLPEAVSHYEQALRINPDSAQTHNNLGSALLQLGRTNEAKRHYEEALRLRPDYAKARENLERLRTAVSAPPIDP